MHGEGGKLKTEMSTLETKGIRINQSVQSIEDNLVDLNSDLDDLLGMVGNNYTTLKKE